MSRQYLSDSATDNYFFMLLCCCCCCCCPLYINVKPINKETAVNNSQRHADACLHMKLSLELLGKAEIVVFQDEIQSIRYVYVGQSFCKQHVPLKPWLHFYRISLSIKGLQWHYQLHCINSVCLDKKLHSSQACTPHGWLGMNLRSRILDLTQKRAPNCKPEH